MAGNSSTLYQSSREDKTAFKSRAIAIKDSSVAQDEVPPGSPVVKQELKNSSKETELLSPDPMDDMADQLFFQDNLALKDDLGDDYDMDPVETEIEREPAKDDTPDSYAREAMFLQFGR